MEIMLYAAPLLTLGFKNTLAIARAAITVGSARLCHRSDTSSLLRWQA